MMIRPSSSGLEKFCNTISKVGKPIVLSIVPGFCESYVPLESKGILPRPISELYLEEYLSLPYHEVLTKCEETFAGLSVN